MPSTNAVAGTTRTAQASQAGAGAPASSAECRSTRRTQSTAASAVVPANPHAQGPHDANPPGLETLRAVATPMAPSRQAGSDEVAGSERRAGTSGQSARAGVACGLHRATLRERKHAGNDTTGRTRRCCRVALILRMASTAVAAAILSFGAGRAAQAAPRLDLRVGTSGSLGPRAPRTRGLAPPHRRDAPRSAQ